MQKYLLILFGFGVLIAYYFDFKKNSEKEKGRKLLYIVIISLISILTVYWIYFVFFSPNKV